MSSVKSFKDPENKLLHRAKRDCFISVAKLDSKQHRTIADGPTRLPVKPGRLHGHLNKTRPFFLSIPDDLIQAHECQTGSYGNHRNGTVKNEAHKWILLRKQTVSRSMACKQDGGGGHVRQEPIQRVHSGTWRQRLVVTLMKWGSQKARRKSLALHPFTLASDKPLLVCRVYACSIQHFLIPTCKCVNVPEAN